MGATVHPITTRRPFMSRFGISRCLARNGIDAVYEGVQRDSGERFAVRRTHPHLIDRRVREHVVKTARQGMNVHHRNVIPVEEVVDHEGDVFVVSKFVEGATLERLVSRKPLPRRIAMRIALDVCAGLSAIHAARSNDGTRLLHRDVSPANIIVGTDGIARLADFGIAKQLEEVDDAAPLRAGKCGYAAPEYILTGFYDVRSDVFALGIVLWELFAGRRLFAGTSDDDVLQRALFEDAPSLVACDVAPAIASVVARATARPATYRYSSVSQVEVELEEASRGKIASHAEVALFVATLDRPNQDAEIPTLENPDETPTHIVDMHAALEDLGYLRQGAEAEARTG